jgi:hypothetical protein
MVVHPIYYQQAAQRQGQPAGQKVENVQKVQEVAQKAEKVGELARHKVVLFFGGFAPPRTHAIATQLLRRFGPRIELVVLCGRNRGLLGALRRRVSRARLPSAGARERETWGAAVAEGFLPAAAVVQHISSAVCVMGKPGPGSATEAAVLGVPFVSERGGTVMPQERAVLEWLEQSGCGLAIRSLEEPPADLLERLDACRVALRSLENRAVFQVSARIRHLLLLSAAAARPAGAGPAAARESARGSLAEGQERVHRGSFSSLFEV